MQPGRSSSGVVDIRPTQARIAAVIRALMAANQESQGDLARFLHVDQTAISRMLNGTRKMTVDELAAVAEHYGQDPGVFFAGVEDLIRSRCFSGLRLVHSSAPGQLELDFDHDGQPAELAVVS